MGALIWNSGIALSIFLGFYLTYQSTHSRKISNFIGSLVFIFWISWTVFGLSKIVMGYRLRGELMTYQSIVIIVTFYLSYIVIKHLEKKQKKIKQQEVHISKQDETIIELEKTNSDLRTKLDHINDEILNRYINDIKDDEITTILDAKDHHIFLIDSLKNAQSDFIVRSGWANVNVIDHHFVALIKKKLSEGVNIYFGYGYQSYGQKQSEQSESEARAEYEFDLIKDWTKQSQCNGRLVIKYFPNHSKLLIVDDKYAVCGSFNWLSNSGRTVNSEESWVIRNQNFINERKNVIVNSFLDN